MVRWVGDSTSENPRREKSLDPGAWFDEYATELQKLLGAGSGTNYGVPFYQPGDGFDPLGAIKKDWAAVKAKATQTAVVDHDGPVGPQLIGLMSAMRTVFAEGHYLHGGAAEFCWYVSPCVMEAVLADAALMTGVPYAKLVKRLATPVAGKPGGVDLLGCPMYIVPGLRPGCFVLRVLHDTPGDGDDG